MDYRRPPSAASIVVKIFAAILLVCVTAVVTVGIMNPFGFFEYGKLLSFRIATSTINRLYYGEITSELLFEGAMRGMTEAIADPYTTYINREDSAMFRMMMEGGFYGVGIHVATTEDNEVVVVAPIPNSPAYYAGLVSNDIILKVDGQEVSDSISGSSLIRGPEGTQVSLTIRRADGEIVDIEITRARIEISTVESRILDGNIAYISISQFSQTTARELSDALNAFDIEPYGIVLDLRNNGGGILDSAVEIAGNFLPRGTLVAYSDGRGVRRREYRTQNNSPLDMPLVLLTNGFSASASEILVGALRDHERAISVGETTFGKGLIQMSFPFGGGALNITSARYFTPNGNDIDGIGIAPDVEVSQNGQPSNDENDAQLQAAIRELWEKINQ